MILSSTAMPEISQTVCSTIAVSMGSLMMTRCVLLFPGQLSLKFLVTPCFLDQVSKEISGRDPWAGSTQQRQQQKGAWVNVLSSSEVVLGKTRPEAGFSNKDKVENLVPFTRKSLRSVPPLSLSRVVHLVFLTFMSHCCFVCEMFGRVWPVVQTTTHVLHPAHVWGSLARTP